MACSARASRSGESHEAEALEVLPVLQALADPSRLKIVLMLRDREQCVCHLTEALALSQGTISHHMSVLKRAGLVVDRRDPGDARWTYYSLSPSALPLGLKIAGLLDSSGTDPALADCGGR